jgi:malate dehydrogenase (oxaloacetate-decarboxylating)
MKAIDQGVARIKKSRNEVYEEAYKKIKAARDQTKLLMEKGFIPPPPE